MTDSLNPSPDQNIVDPVKRGAEVAVQQNNWQALAPGTGRDPRAEAMLRAHDQSVVAQAEAQQEAEDHIEALGMLAAMADPMAYLKEFATPNQQEISVDTLTEDEKAKIKRVFINCRSIADHHYRDTIEPKILERREIFDATIEHYKKRFPSLSEYSDWVSKDVKTQSEWILATIAEAFIGGEDPISVKGVNIEDDEKAENIQQLIKYQLINKNNYVDWVLSMLWTALRDNFAVTKVYWKREEERHSYDDMIGAKDVSKQIAIMDGITRGNIEVNQLEPLQDAPDLSYISFDEVKLKANHPVVEFLPSSEFRYTPDEANIWNCKFVAHRKVVRGDYLKRKEAEGIYTNVDKALKEFSTGNTTATQLDINNDLARTDRIKNPDDNDNASKQVELYEAYLKVDYNNDGIFEDIIVHAVGDNIIRIARNDFDIPPFFIFDAVHDPNAVFSMDSYSDDLEQLQDLKTALIRQIIVNTAKNNSPRIFVDERLMDMDALVSGDEIIGCNGNPQSMIWSQPNLMMTGNAMDIIQYAQNELEAQSGSTRYNQGLNNDSLNKTAHGITAIMGASEKRMKLLARSIAERAFIPVYKFLILMNQKYLDDGQMIRLTNKSVSIRREDLDVDYDLIVNVGQGAGSKEATIHYLTFIIQSIYPVLQNMGVVDAKSWFNIVSRLLNEIGLRDVTQYLLDPDSDKARQAAEEAKAAAIQEKAEALQNSLQLSIAKTSVPKATINLKDLPPDAQVQYYKQKLGITTTEQAIAQHEEDLANSK